MIKSNAREQYRKVKDFNELKTSEVRLTHNFDVKTGPIRGLNASEDQVSSKSDAISILKPEINASEVHVTSKSDAISVLKPEKNASKIQTTSKSDAISVLKPEKNASEGQVSSEFDAKRTWNNDNGMIFRLSTKRLPKR